MVTIFRMLLASTLVFAIVSRSWADGGEGDRPSDRPAARLPGTLPISLPSLDSVTAWTDQYHLHEWRIQQHVESHEHRLLDDDNKMRASGSFEHCLEALNEVKREHNWEPHRGKAVLLLHGLAAPRWSMNLLAQHLKKHSGYHTFVLEYASLCSGIDSQARGLANVIRGLEELEEINLVGHSMGNIVIRRYLAGDDSATTRWRPDPRIGRIVMIAPPNHGSITATRLADFSLFQKLLGESGQQLGKKWDDIEPRLAIPAVEFGIIAGGFGNSLGLSLSVPGDDDGRISVETTRLAGAKDFTVVPAVHEFIAHDPRVFSLTRQFLTSGYFISPEKMQGIPRDPIAVSRRELQ